MTIDRPVLFKRIGQGRYTFVAGDDEDSRIGRVSRVTPDPTSGWKACVTSAPDAGLYWDRPLDEVRGWRPFDEMERPNARWGRTRVKAARAAMSASMSPNRTPPTRTRESN